MSFETEYLELRKKRLSENVATAQPESNLASEYMALRQERLANKAQDAVNQRYQSQLDSYSKSLQGVLDGYDKKIHAADAEEGWADYIETRKQTAQNKQTAKENKTWIEKLIGYLGTSQDTSLPVHMTSEVTKGVQEQDEKLNYPDDGWSEDQKLTFGYLWKTNRQKAWEYSRMVNTERNRQAEQEKLLRIQESATKNLGAGAAHTVGSVLAAPLGLADTLGDIIEMGALGHLSDSDGEVTPNEYSEAVKGSIAHQLNEKTGTLREDIPIVGGKGLGDVYGLGTSIAQSMLAAFSGGGAQALVTSFGPAVQAGINSAKSRGATDEQAMSFGLMSGLAEALAEHIGVDNLLKIGSANTMKELSLNILKQGAAEGLEEGITSLATNFADRLVMADKSEFNLAVLMYMSNGMNKADAEKQAWLDMAENVLFDMFAGFVSGGVSGGVYSGIQNAQSNTQTKTLYSSSQQELVAEALELDPGNAFALKMKGILDSGKNLTGSQLNKLVQMNEAAVKKGTSGSEAAQQAQGVENTATGNVNTADVAEPQGLRLPSVEDDMKAQAVNEPLGNQHLTFQEKVQRQFEKVNGYTEPEQKTYDIDEVFSAVKSAHSSGAISEERYSDIVDTLAFAQSDLAEGNITEEEYQGMLETAIRQVSQQSGRQVAPAVSATDPMVDVDRQTWQQAQRLAKALGRDIVFYNGVRGENGYYKDGTIYVNILADDPFAQVVSHELTHSLEGTRHYDRLKRFVFAQMARTNIDLAQARKAKADQYKSHGKELRGQAEIDAEIVAEYVQTHLLTDEQAIMDLVAAERNVAKRILDWLSNFARRIVGKQASREQARLEYAIRIYGKALQESRNGNAGRGNVSLRSQGAVVDQSRGGELRQSREQTEADYREGRITDEEYDAAMDEYDRAEDERLGHSLEKYSFAGENANNANLDALARAKEMQAAGVADETIRQQTGWYVGMDGKWRWEIDDSGMEYSSRGDFGLQERRPDYARYRELLDKANRYALELSDEALTPGETAELQKLKDIWGGTFRTAGRITDDALQTETLSDYVKHDALFEAYPQLRKTRLRFADMPEGTRGQYDPEQDVITVSQKLRGKPQDTLVHEIQHAIQRAEGFASGSSMEYWMTRLDKDRQQKVELADKKYRDLFDSMPEKLKNRVRAYNRAILDYDYDEAIAIEEELLEGEFAELFSAWKDADFERRNLRERYKAADLTEDAITNYRNTAGEIEARDSAVRRTMTQEQRKNTPPDLGGKDTVFVDGDSGVGYSIAEPFVDSNGTSYDDAVLLDTTFFDGLSPRNWGKKLKEFVEFRAKTNPVILPVVDETGSVQQLQFANPQDRVTKVGGSNHKVLDELSSGSDNISKLAVVHIDEIVEVSEADLPYYTSDNTHQWLDQNGWLHRKANVINAKNGNIYSLTLDIAKTRDGRHILYATKGKIKRVGNVQVNSLKLRGSGQNSNSESIVSHAENDVKKYSFSDMLMEEDNRRPAEGSYTTDEVEMQARKKGYPVLHGEQIVPFRTWVRTVDRGNYGLVTGMAPESKLLVSFHNKHDGGTADNVPIAYENLVPVPGTYQMTKEEFASLMDSEPVDPGSSQLSEEDMRAIEELYNQARGNEEKQASPIDFEKLPRKAQNYLNRAKRNLLRNIRKTLGVPQAAMQEHLQGVVDEIAGEYLNSGTVSDEKLVEFFDKAYAQGIVTDREFYDQYKHIKDHLRTTAVTISERDRANIADFNDFRRRQFGRLRIVNQGGLPVDTAYDELRSMAPELFPEDIAHPADQLVHMAEVARSIEISKKTLDEFAGPERETFRAWAKNDFDVAVGEILGDLHAVRRFADERAAKAAREKAPATPDEAMEAYKNLKKARRLYERVAAKNLLTQHDEAQVGRLLRHEIELEHLDPEKDNVKGITAVYEAKVEYERLCKLITDYKRHLHGKLRDQADQYLKTANDWKDKKVGIAYARETMRRNIYDIVTDRSLAREINEVYFEPVHDAEAKAVHLKDEYRNKVREMNLSRKVAKGNLVSEAHAVQLLGEAMDNIRILENTKGRMQHRDGKSLADWRGVVMKLWDENPNLDQEKIRGAVQQFRQIYDNLFEQMNKVRVENGYEPINYRSGYFPHFQPGEADGILAQFGRALGIDTQVVALPTTIAGLTHTFKPGIQWFGNAQERLGFNTAYDAVEGFDKYIEGAASVIFQTENIQRLRAFATQVRYRTSNEGIQEQVDAVYEDNRLTDDEKQVKIANIYEHGKFALANFVAELDEYTNLLANKKSKYDRTVEALMGRKVYAFLKWWESRVGANMIAGNISSALTNFIPLTQAGAQMDRFAILNGMWKTLTFYKTDDGLHGMSSFLTNRKGSDPLVQNWSQKVSGKLSIPMEAIDQFVSESIVRGAYFQNLKRGMSESEAMHQADIFAAGVMADRSKGAMPTLMQSSNPLFKMFTQFQLEVNNQFSEVFKDLPRNHRQQGILHFALVLFKYFLGAWLFNKLYEWLVGRRPALDPIGLLIDACKDFADPDVGFGEGMKNLGTNVLSELPFSSGLTLLGIETDGGRIPASSAVPDLTAVWDAATDKDMHWKKRLKEIGDEVAKPLTYVIPPFGGNQISKIWKGTKAFIEGGSYSLDSKGNEILQYPVYNDDPWAALGSLFRATLLGKSSLPEAQEWVESGFDSLGAKETAVYQDMLDGGISQKEAFGLIQALGAARETDIMTVDEVKRNILQNSGVSAEGKSVAFYGLLASDAERGVMDALADTDADLWEVVKTLMAMKDAGKLEGVEKTNAKYDAIIQAALTDEEKSVLVGSIIGTDMETEKGNLTQYAKFKVAVEGGMSVDEYLKFRKDGGDIDDYLDFSKAGLDTDDAVEISLALDELVPLDGKERVSEIQQWRTCVNTFSHTASQLAALAGVMTDKQYAKVNLAYDYDISPDVYVTLRETLVKYDTNGNGSLSNSEVTDAINSMRGLSKKQKAVLWQLSVSSRSAKNNPYSTTEGQRVLDAINKNGNENDNA